MEVAAVVNILSHIYVYIMTETGRRGPKTAGETRRRIVEAAVALHEEVGPAATTIKAIAERSGVQRLTVYRHFGDERAVLGACSTHWSRAHPLPDSAEWAGEADPADRLQLALGAVYGYFRQGAVMLEKVLRDEPQVEALAAVMVPYHAWFRELVGQLSAGWGVRGAKQRRVRAVLAHALRFETWRSLTGAGLTDEEAVVVMRGLVAATAHAADNGATQT